MARPPAPRPLPALQGQLGQFADEYNHRRPHRSLDRATPAGAYAARPKAAPIPGSGRPATRTARVTSNGTITSIHEGRRHHIALGRRRAGTTVLAITHGLRVQIADAATGELLRDLTIDPDPRLPAHRQPTRPHQKPSPRNVRHPVRDVLRHHRSPAAPNRTR